MKTGLPIVSIAAVHWSFHCTNSNVLANGLETIFSQNVVHQVHFTFPVRNQFVYEHPDPAKGPFTLTS